MDETTPSYRDARGVIKAPPGSPPPEIWIRVVRGDIQSLLEWQRERLDVFWPVMQAAVRFNAADDAYLQAAVKGEASRAVYERDVAEANVFAAVAALPDGVRAELERVDDTREDC